MQQEWQELKIELPIEKQIIATQVANRDILITKNNDNFYAIQDECPHEGIKLSLGCIKNNAIKCSLHGFSFDLASGLCDENSVEMVITYPIKLENNKLWIQIS
jgi:nitrite reductase/ring-hydroxylating ferredoxin subunit